jgi:hypothetical protein
MRGVGCIVGDVTKKHMNNTASTTSIETLAREIIAAGSSRREAGESLASSLVNADGGGFDHNGDFQSHRLFGLSANDRNAALAMARRIAGVA